MLGNEYKEYCNNFNNVWKYLKSCSKDIDTIADEICKYRLYYHNKDKWAKLLDEIGVLFVSSDTCDYERLKIQKFNDLALFSKDGHFLLNQRYIIPVRDMLGNIVAMIGWYPDSKRYITTPSKFFSKGCLFFGMEQLSKTGIGEDYFLVEGIFDSLSVRLLGLNCVAHMGISDSRVKEVLYGLFGRICAIPDNDTQGRKVLNNDSWKIPRNGCYLKWTGGMVNEDTGEVLHIKDIDRLCSIYDDDSVRAILHDSITKSKNRVVKIDLS